MLYGLIHNPLKDEKILLKTNQVICHFLKALKTAIREALETPY
jgi:hypothetical protein